MSGLLQSVLSPRFYRSKRSADITENESLEKSESVLKLGDLYIISGVCKLNAHIQVVRDDHATTAQFYSDSDKTIRYGTLSLAKCNISLSETHLSTIQVTKQNSDEKRNPGLLLRAKSHADAVEWLSVLSCEDTSFSS